MNVMRRLKSIASGRTSISSDPVSLTSLIYFPNQNFNFWTKFHFFFSFGCWENGHANVDHGVNMFVVLDYWEMWNDAFVRHKIFFNFLIWLWICFSTLCWCHLFQMWMIYLLSRWLWFWSLFFIFILFWISDIALFDLKRFIIWLFVFCFSKCVIFFFALLGIHLIV